MTTPPAPDTEIESPDSSLDRPAAQLRPRPAPADAFEQNPLEAIAERLESMPDDARMREALRQVIEEGGDLEDSAKEWRVTPAALSEWRARYFQMLNEDSIATTDVPLLDTGEITGTPDLTHIPEAARLRFAENWERLLEVTQATPDDFRQNAWELFLQNSWMTSWLYSEGKLERGVLAGVACAVVGMILTSSFLLADTTVETLPPVEERVAPRDDLTIQEAAKLAQAFLQAPTWQDRLAMVYKPEEARPLMEEHYLHQHDTPVPDVILKYGMTSRNISSLCFDVPSLNRAHFFNVVHASNGRMYLDWETSSLFQEAHLERLRENRPRNPVRICVTVSLDSYYNFDFGDEQRWKCFKIGYPGTLIDLYGYLPAGSAGAIALETLLKASVRAPVVLEVRYPENSTTDNQVEITAVVSESWLPEVR